MGGELFHGSQDIAEKMGDMTIDMNVKIYECGIRDCLQTFANGASIAAFDSKQAINESL